LKGFGETSSKKFPHEKKQMKTYLLTLIAAALVAALVGILSPEGERGGIGKHMKLLTSLFLICVLIAPLERVIDGLRSLADGSFEITLPEGEGKEDFRTELESSMNSASASYFGEMLTQTLEAQFSIQTGDVRCAVKWENNGENLAPTRVTVYLSGKAIWQDPRAIEAFVGELLGCECITVIE
jgi:hypothetical protein